METKRIRFGMKTNFPFGLFPNAGIIVFRTDTTNAARVQQEVERLRLLLMSIGQQPIADRIVFEITG